MRLAPISIAVFASALGSSAFAAGYSCLSVDRDTHITVEMSEVGVGQAQKIIFKDPTLSERSQTIVEFSAAEAEINSELLPTGERFVSTVSEDVEHPGRNLGGTKLGLLSTVSLEIQTSTRRHKIQCLSEGSIYAAEVVYLKKDGQVLKQDFDCTLFLGENAPLLDLEN